TLYLGVVSACGKIELSGLAGVGVFGALPYHVVLGPLDIDFDARTALDAAAAPGDCHRERCSGATQPARLYQDIVRAQPHHLAPMASDQVDTIGNKPDFIIPGFGRREYFDPNRVVLLFLVHGVVYLATVRKINSVK